MTYFLSILRQSLRYRWTVASSLACSLMVGILWGANIGTLYPLITIVLNGESLSSSLTRQIGESMTGFFQTLLDWEAVERCAEERAERTQPPASSKVIRRARR